MRPRLAWVLAAWMSGGCAGKGTPPDGPPPEVRPQASSAEPYRPNRDDYAVFKQRVQGLYEAPGEDVILEPNYLPYMLHRIAGEPGASERLVVCRWPDTMMPLRVYVEAPVIPESLQNEFRPIPPDAYVESVGHALDTWEEQLEGLVAFERVADRDAAVLVLRIRGRRAPTPEPGFRGLGRTEALNQACRLAGRDGTPGVASVHFEVPTLDIFIADDAGLLQPRQVEGVALHEVGHVLGMKGHSPIPVDHMYAVPTDRIYGTAGDPELGELTTQDLNSFISLYRLPSGTVFRTQDGASLQGRRESPRGRGMPPAGPPVLAMAPHVDARAGFELRVPQHWTRVVSEYGLFAANGPLWDYDVSIEIFLWPHPTIADYLSRHGPALFRNSQMIYRAPVVIDGHKAVRAVVESLSEAIVKDFIFIELGDGRVMIILCESPIETSHLWQEWFFESLASLEIWPSKVGETSIGSQ